MDYQDIEFHVEDGIAWLLLNRPSAMNGLTMRMSQELGDAVRRCNTDAAIRCVVIGGNGRAFCAGADVKEFGNQLSGGDVSTYVRQLADDLHLNVVIALRRLPKIVVGMINGVVAGGGLGLSLIGDYRIASDQARFTSAYSNIAVNPDGGSTYLLPRIIGPSRALELYLTNDVVGADRALELGLVHKVVPADDLLKETAAFAGRMAAGPTLAYAKAKHLYHVSLSNDLVTQLDLESEYISQSVTTEDFRNGVEAFMNKAKPTFRGR
ncbi:MAG TPA: enoyl-CoA hydratase-related protein [Dehalococcoidia bacterium]|nr:enoyl-CoA hydratase-related protein [Dehalococcoidia bacterium]